MVSFTCPKEVFDRYLRVAPLAHALFRTAEARHLATVEMRGPVLDLGCGHGQFATIGLRAPLDVGLDVSASELERAKRGKVYGRLRQGDARALPFLTGTFQSVLSVSVLEHIPDSSAVLREVARVLRPGGVLVCTIVLADLHQHLFFPFVLRGLGLKSLGRWYVEFQDRLMGHQSMYTQETWENMLAAVGLEIRVSRKMVSPRLTRWWDLLLPSACLYRWFGWLWRPRWCRRAAWHCFEAALAEDAAEGSCLFVVAQKPLSRSVGRCLAPAAIVNS